MSAHRDSKNRRLSAEEAPGFNVSERTALGIIVARINYVEERIATAKANGIAPVYDIREVTALRWALGRLGVVIPNDRS